MSYDLKYAYLQTHPLFAGLSEQKVKEAAQMAKLKTVYRGESFVFGEGNYSKIFLLIKGKIKITDCDEQDNEMIKEILTAPDVFGDLSLENHLSPTEYAEALTANTVICYFNIVDFRKFLQDNPLLALRYANTVNSKLKKLENRHSDLVFRDTKSRLIGFIKNWARTDGDRVGDKIILNNYLTHSDIANVISTSRQSVNVLLNELRDSGLLFYNRKQIELKNMLAWS